MYVGVQSFENAGIKKTKTSALETWCAFIIWLLLTPNDSENYSHYDLMLCEIIIFIAHIIAVYSCMDFLFGFV